MNTSPMDHLISALESRERVIAHLCAWRASTASHPDAALDDLIVDLVANHVDDARRIAALAEAVERHPVPTAI